MLNNFIKHIELKVIENRLAYVKKSLALFLFIGMLMSYNLWINDRNFPLFPIFENSILPSPFGFIIFAIQLLLLIAVFFSNKKQIMLFIYLVFSLSLIQDQLRWQPWVYLYLLAFLPFLLLNRNENKRLSISYLQCLLIGVYIWSGIHKFNLNFIDIDLENISVNFFRITDVEHIDLIKSYGYLIPLFEILTGILLWFSKTRKYAVYMAIFIHLFVLYYLSPFSMYGNSIVVPWNIEMIVLVFLLFYKNENSISFVRDGGIKKNTLRLTIIVIFSLPVLNFFGLWDHYLSFSLYSSKTPNFYIISKNPPKNIKEYLLPLDGMEGGKIISLGSWADQELNVPFYPESRIFHSFIDYYKNNVEDKDLIFLETTIPLYERQSFNTYGSKRKKIKYDNYNYLSFTNPIYLDTTTIKVFK